jgi:hypothetical protein
MSAHTFKSDLKANKRLRISELIEEAPSAFQKNAPGGAMMGAWSHFCGPRDRSRRGVRNRCRYAEVRTITAAIVAALFFGGVMQTSDVRSPILTQTHVIGLDLTVGSSKLGVKCGYFQGALLRRRFPGLVLAALEL